jgi:hypothetical protein
LIEKALAEVVCGVTIIKPPTAMTVSRILILLRMSSPHCQSGNLRISLKWGVQDLLIYINLAGGKRAVDTNLALRVCQISGDRSAVLLLLSAISRLRIAQRRTSDGLRVNGADEQGADRLAVLSVISHCAACFSLWNLGRPFMVSL